MSVQACPCAVFGPVLRAVPEELRCALVRERVRVELALDLLELPLEPARGRVCEPVERRDEEREVVRFVAIAALEGARLPDGGLAHRPDRPRGNVLFRRVENAPVLLQSGC